ncbi:hypothetical protein BJ322DRAFT_1025687 [Thelephora terrestris]|uniref:Uncharacterized protein n=1 Tax=Thelephora terrestris TaxID=56493 RepID=A0A9P6L081_9AGAM|nr:hypothetical protein BJ322DRAFT_1025687 [Thelephora terrestris]
MPPVGSDKSGDCLNEGRSKSRFQGTRSRGMNKEKMGPQCRRYFRDVDPRWLPSSARNGRFLNPHILQGKHKDMATKVLDLQRVSSVSRSALFEERDGVIHLEGFPLQRSLRPFAYDSHTAVNVERSGGRIRETSLKDTPSDPQKVKVECPARRQH